MENLKNSLALLLCPFMFACQSTRVFHLEHFHDLHVVHVKSDRIRQKCVFLNAEAENNWRHQYLIYVLNEKREVLEIAKSTHMDPDSCQSQIQAIEKLLKAEAQIKICVRDPLEKIQDPEYQKETVSFGPLGRHEVIFKTMTLDSICNSKKCAGDNSAWVKSCPGFEKHNLKN